MRVTQIARLWSKLIQTKSSGKSFFFFLSHQVWNHRYAVSKHGDLTQVHNKALVPEVARNLALQKPNVWWWEPVDVNVPNRDFKMITLNQLIIR